MPFQRSTIVLYWNKDAFRAAGLDPDRAPATWQEHAEFAAKLTQRNGGDVTRWGMQIPSTGFPYWLFQALATEAGGTLANADGTATDFANPACVEALRYWIDLSTKYQAHPPGIVDWGTTPRDFLEQKVAMIWTTTGNLSNIRTNAKFPFGVAMLPADKQRGSPTGGGNFYLFKCGERGRSSRPACGCCAGSAVPNARRNGASTPAMSRPGPTRGRRAAMREICRRISPPPRWRATSCNTRWRNCPRTTTSASRRR